MNYLPELDEARPARPALSANIGYLWKTPIHGTARNANSYEHRLRRENRDTIAIDPIASIAQITEPFSMSLCNLWSLHVAGASCGMMSSAGIPGARAASNSAVAQCLSLSV
jgi:hypothetical protein